MSATSPAASPLRRTSAASAQQPVRRQPGRAAFFDTPASNREDEIRLNLADIPRSQDSMDVDGFKPSLLSRLLDLVAPVKRR